MVYGWFKQRRAAANRQHTSERIAERAFLDAYPSRTLISRMTGVFHDDGSSVVIQVCDDWGGKPPRRSWWLVSSDGECRELTLAEVSVRRPVPPWR
jgi:hypothetical protein